MNNIIPLGTRVRVKVPAKCSYTPKLARIISMTTDGKYVVQLDEPMFVECIADRLDIMSARPERVTAL